MQPNQLANQNSKLKSTRKLFGKSVCPEDLVLLAKADALGRTINQDYTKKNMKNALNDYKAMKKNRINIKRNRTLFCGIFPFYYYNLTI